jgi:hypothetical protein
MTPVFFQRRGAENAEEDAEKTCTIGFLAYASERSSDCTAFVFSALPLRSLRLCVEAALAHSEPPR